MSETIFGNWKPFKNNEKCFLFHHKKLFCSHDIQILSLLLIPKFMTSQSRKRTIATHILRNILRSKGNQRMKFGQLIEYNTRNIFPISYTKCGEETIPRPFPRKSKVLYSLSLLYAKLTAIEIYLN